jgi:hypothetical protein
MTKLSKAKVFTKLDIIGAFNRIRMKLGTKRYTAFITKYGQYESVVLPFGLTGGPAAFQGYINMDNIFVYPENVEEHED